MYVSCFWILNYSHSSCCVLSFWLYIYFYFLYSSYWFSGTACLNPIIWWLLKIYIYVKNIDFKKFYSNFYWNYILWFRIASHTLTDMLHFFGTKVSVSVSVFQPEQVNKKNDSMCFLSVSSYFVCTANNTVSFSR